MAHNLCRYHFISLNDHWILLDLSTQSCLLGNMDASLLQILDQQLAADDFYARLCLVSSIVDHADGKSTNADDANAASLEDEVSTCRLWPALKFDSHKELMKYVASASIPSNSLGHVQGYLTMEYYRQLKSRRRNNSGANHKGKISYGVAYLLGRQGKESKIPPVVLLSPNEEGEVITDNRQVFDFYEHFSEMDQGEGSHCGSDEFQVAFQLTLHRIENSSGGTMDSGANADGKKVNTAVTEGGLTRCNITSARKTISNVEYTPLRTEIEQGKKINKKKQPTKEPTKRERKAAAPPKEDPVLDEVECGQLPVKTVEFSQNGTSGSVSSPEKPFSDVDSVNHSPIARSRKQRCSPAEEREMPWVTMFSQMKADGWSFLQGAGLIEWFYLHPTCKGMKKTELLRTKVAGVDYFTSEEDLMRYARLNLGWTGSVESVADSPKDAEMADRVKKRARGLNVQRNKKQIEVKPAVAKEKNPTKISKVANKQQVHTPKRSADPDSPESSRFSSGSISHRTRSHASSPTVSELEVDIGVQSAKRKKSANQKKLQFATQNDFSNESSVESESVSGRSTPSDATGDSSSSSDSSTDSEQISEDETYQIMSGSSAWRLLQERFSFTYHSSKYCLPGKENRPGKDSTAEDGLNYFSSLDNLRKHLCAYGLPEVKKHLTEEDVRDLSRWVRYANVLGLSDGALINPKDIGEPINFMKAWNMLQKLGMKYTNGYIYPTSDPSKIPLKFERPQDFTVHLARFGIPHVDGIQPSKVLSEGDRFKLDLFIADADRDCFVRVEPNSGVVNEITPRRTRSGRTTVTESELVKPTVMKIAGYHSTKQTLKCSAYQMEFNQMTYQRKFPVRLLSSQTNLETLVDCYNIHVQNRDGKEYYCLPNIRLTEGEDSMLGRDYFENVQCLRENLCAYGLPPVAKGAKMNATKLRDLESWIRCANVSALRDEPTADIPQDIDMSPKDVRRILKGFKYAFSDNTQTYLLPGTSFHKSRLGHDRFNSFIDLVNHVARFGLDDSEVLDAQDLPFSEMERLELEIFMSSVATFDVGKRIQCTTPVRNKRATSTEIALTGPPVASSISATETVVAEVDVTSTPCHPAVVDDECDQDSPQSVLPKKPKTGVITNYFQNVVQKLGEVVASTFSPRRQLKSNHSVTSSLNNLSPSCMDMKGDDDVEACFAETPDRSSTFESVSHPNHGLGTPNTHVMKGDDNVESCFAETPDNNTSFECAAHPDHGLGTPKTHVDTLGTITAQGISVDMEHYPQAESPSITWSELWQQMRKSGWIYRSGNELVAWFWIHPSVANMKKADMVRQCTEGIHYFTSEEDVRRYATKHLGWSGGGTTYDSSPAASDISMTARVKKRNQENALKFNASPPKRARVSSERRTEVKASPTLKSSSSPHRTTGGCEESTCDSGSEDKAPPDRQPTVGDKLKFCEMVLHPTYKKNRLSKSAFVSVVSSMEADIKDFMTKSIETGLSVDGMTSPSPGFLYICGGPGTGKTTAVTSCADEMKVWAKNSGYDKPTFCLINMASNQVASNGKGGIMGALLMKLARALEIDKESDISVFEKHFKKRVVVLVLDEIDMLFKQHGRAGETCFRTLIDLAERTELKFSLIGISNCVNDDNATRVRELGHSPRELVFSTYKEHDILAILEQRLGKYVVDHKALQLISRRVAASTGDARRALEITSNAVGKCLDSLTDEELQKEVNYDDECMPLVKLPHMMRAIREGMPMRHADVISGLPQAAKVILCIAVSVSQVWGPTAEISVSTLKKFCVEASHHSLMDDLGIGHIMSLVEMLIDSGLLLSHGGQFNPYDSNPKLRIGVQLDDVEIALEESLLKQGFYRALVDYVRRECPRPSSPN